MTITDATVADALAVLDTAESRLRNARRVVDDMRRAWSFERGYCVPLPIEKLRREVGRG